MTAGQKRFDDWLAGRAEQAGGRAAFLRADGRADEIALGEHPKKCVQPVRDVLSAAQKANGGEEQAARRFFAEKLGRHSRLLGNGPAARGAAGGHGSRPCRAREAGCCR